MVRIRLPPAESQVQTCLSREFAFLGREAAIFRGCPGRTSRLGRQRHAGAEISGRKAVISLSALFQYRTVGDEVGADAADLIADERLAVMSANSRCRAG